MDRSSPPPSSPLSESSLEETATRAPKRYCCGRLSLKGLLILLAVLFIIGAGLAVLITYLVAKSVIENATVKPTEITMKVHGYKGSNTRDQSKEYIVLALKAAVTNEAFLGGELLSTQMDVYANDKKMVSMTIPDTKVEGNSDGLIVDICNPENIDEENDSACVLRNLNSQDTDALHSLINLVKNEKKITMKMVAPDGIKLKSMGITLPFNFDFSKEFIADGMDGALSKVEAKLDFSDSTSDEMKLAATAQVYNPSIFGFTLLPSKMKVFTPRDKTLTEHNECQDQIFIGTSNTELMDLAPHKTVQVTMRGQMSKIVKPICLQNFVQKYLTGKESKVIAEVGSDATESELLNQMLRSTQLTATVVPINDALIQGLAFSSLEMKNPTPDSIEMSSVSKIGTYPLLGTKATYQIVSVGMSVKMKSEQGQVLGSVEVLNATPTESCSANLTVPIDGVMQLMESGQPMAGWMKKFIDSKTINLLVEGTSQVSAILPGMTEPVTLYDIPVANMVALDGMNLNGVMDVAVDSFDLPSNSENGIALSINSSFHNPSIARLSVGKLYGKLMHAGSQIGLIQVPDFAIQPGTNTFHADGEIIASSDESFNALEKFFNNYLGHKSSSCHIEAFIEGSDWLSSVLSQTRMVSTIEGMNSSIQVVEKMAFNEDHDLNVYMKRNALPAFEGQLRTAMKIPFDFPVEIVAYGGQVDLSSGGTALGRLQLKPKECSGSCSTREEMILDMEATLDPAGCEAGFESFVQKVITATDVEMDIKGDLSCTISTNLNYKGKYLRLTAPIDTSDLKGLYMPGFGPIEIQKMSVSDGTPTVLPMTSDALIANPTSFVNMYASGLTMDVFYRGSVLARMSSVDQDLALLKNSKAVWTLAGETNKEMEGFNKEMADEAFESFMNNRVSNVTVRGVQSDYLLQNGFILDTTIPPLQCSTDGTPGCPLVRGTTVTSLGFNSAKELWGRLTTNETFNLVDRVFVDMAVHNPFEGTHMYPTYTYINVVYDGQTLGYIERNVSGVLINGLETLKVPFVTENVSASQNNMKRQMKMTCDLLNDRLYVNGGEGTTFAANIGEYNMKISYRQDGIQIRCGMNNALQTLCDLVMTKTPVITQLVNAQCYINENFRLGYLKEMAERVASSETLQRIRKSLVEMKQFALKKIQQGIKGAQALFERIRKQISRVDRRRRLLTN